MDYAGDLEEGTHGSWLGRVGVRTQCTDPCFLVQRSARLRE